MAPCGWVIAADHGCDCGETAWSGYDAAVRDRAAAAAAMILWAATGRQYGPCPVTIVPASPRNPDPLYRTYPVGPGSGLLSPVVDGGVWYNRPYGDAGESGLCCTGISCEVLLPGPTTKAQITEVTVDGEVVDADAYLVVDNSVLVRTDGQCWPACVNLRETPLAFTVTYTIGLPIPTALQAAFERLACELAKACAGGPCALPQRMTRLSRQGVDIEIEQVPVDARGQTLTGIKDIDDVILALNPARLTSAPTVFSPDLPPARRVT